MICRLRLLLSLLITTVISLPQEQSLDTLNIGDPAPPLHIRAWLKGAPVTQFEKDKIYVLEFWATWCKPCIASMPHLSALASKYRDRATFIAVDVYENKNTSLEKIQFFVDSLGSTMDFAVAAEDSNYMALNWVGAWGDAAIPSVVVIGRNGDITWGGHPKDLPGVLPEIVNNTWDVYYAAARRKENRRLAALDHEVQYLALPYLYNQSYRNHPYKPDTLLAKLEEYIKGEQEMMYAPLVSFYKFGALLHIDLREAYEYGSKLLVTSSYEEPSWDAVITNVDYYGDTLHLSPVFYLLAVDALQKKLNVAPYPQLINLPKQYKKMALFYHKAKENDKAVECIEKAIQLQKDRGEATPSEKEELQSLLKEYSAKF